MSTAEQNIPHSLLEQMLELGRAARAAAAELAEAPAAAKRAALEAAAGELRAARAAVLRANAEDVAAAKERGLSGAMIDRLALDEQRLEATAAGLEAVAAHRGSRRPGHRRVGAAERAQDLARARAARRHRHHLREPAERDGRRGRAVHQERQRGDPARRLGERALERRDSRLPAPRAGAARLARDGRADGADAGSRRRRHHAARHGALHRRDRAARRQGLRRARAAGRARAGHGAPRGDLSHLCSRRAPIFAMARRIVVNAKMRRTGICGATETMLIDRACAATHLQPIVGDLHRQGLRGARRRAHAVERPARACGGRRRLGQGIPRRDRGGARRRRPRRGARAHPPLRLGAHRRDRHGRRRGRGAAS